MDSEAVRNFELSKSIIMESDLRRCNDRDSADLFSITEALSGLPEVAMSDCPLGLRDDELDLGLSPSSTDWDGPGGDGWDWWVGLRRVAWLVARATSEELLETLGDLGR